MSRRLAILVTAGALGLGLTACGGDDADDQPDMGPTRFTDGHLKTRRSLFT